MLNEQTRIFLEILEINKTPYPQVPENNINLYRDIYYTRMLNADSSEYLELDRKIRDIMYEGYKNRELVATEIRHRALIWGVQGEFYMFGYAFSGGRFAYITSAHEKCLKIAERAYREKVNCFPKARHRALFWGGSPACYVHHPNWMYNCWGILTVAQMFNVEGNVIIDTSSLDSALLGVAKNHEHGIMRRHLTGGWQHMLECFEYAHRFNCDIIMINDDITCKGALGMTGMLMEKSKDHPDVKLMWVSNDMFDHRTISRNDMRQQVNEFMTAVMQEKPLDETLLDFDDYEGW